jgi:protein TonB
VNVNEPEDLAERAAAFKDRFQRDTGEETPSAPRRMAPRITRAEAIHRVDPVYDPALVPPGPGLSALLEVTVGPDGTVRNVKVIKSTGIPALDQAAVEALQQYVYKPAERDGVPYESRRLERISFKGMRSN